MARDSTVDGRSERSRRTRARIIKAATALFTEYGYLETTIEEVADRAGVAVQTVYYTFATKRNLLSGVLDASIAGDLEPVPILERPWVSALRAERDADAALERVVTETVRIVERAAPVYEVIRRAAADPDVGALLEENRRARRQGQRTFVEILDGAGHLGAGVTVDTASDILYGLLNEELYRLLVVDCGWPAERYRAWAAETLRSQLLTPGPPAGDERSL